ncbi:GNAT family N-acetyltransferase [Azospirillum griseum]|uniref:N-acetyltransferase n=1 Tax=Azospirillum griseum TaxID=2496639 RepID=A0A3S0K1X7_9PROT|nr:GNAT family N-acetyltransferase [Azospirillum griseum]RTR17041.1 N-acetyltransferase [Azospirillum griseum]
MPMAEVTEFPTLHTDRLLLRAVTLDDAEPFRALLATPGVVDHSNWPNDPTPEQGRDFVGMMADALPRGMGCSWIIEDRQTAAFLGSIRFNYFMRDWSCAGVGYEIHPDCWGRGVMTEALRAVVVCGHDSFGLHRMEAWTLAGNGASDRVLEKAGFRYEGTTRGRGWFKGAYHDARWFGRIQGDPIAP